ncbi:MAG TPA: hypothetical protein VEH31_09705 [Streptosporangiaceae bacterium]|nr:hypothetical protein [Streptosporangiaceae bacterium]
MSAPRSRLWALQIARLCADPGDYAHTEAAGTPAAPGTCTWTTLVTGNHSQHATRQVTITIRP